MTKILFVCHGNICRSPMAEFIMKDLAKKGNVAERLQICSAAVSTEELGNPIYPPARQTLARHGIACSGKTARQITSEDYEAFNLLIGMDRGNLQRMEHICGGDPQKKMHRLLEYAGRPEDVADPWYTRDFEAAWQDISQGCIALLQSLQLK